MLTRARQATRVKLAEKCFSDRVAAWVVKRFGIFSP